jgi:DNA polymerase III epsilon subunit-like protein
MLKQADVLVAHNAKFDVMWLLEMGFRIPDRIYCTMIGEYILAKGQREELSLKATAERRDVTRKKSDLVDELFKAGTGFEAMPLDTVLNTQRQMYVPVLRFIYGSKTTLRQKAISP